MGKADMCCGPVLFTLLLCGLCSPPCAEGQTLQYHFVSESKNWRDAQQHCRLHYHDLATVSSTEDRDRLPRPPDYSGNIWIGLLNNATNSSWWSWSGSDSSVVYDKWTTSAYLHPYPRQCGLMDRGGWAITSCTKLFKALCFSGSHPKLFTITTTAQSWEEAQTYCRTHHMDLAMIESEEENAQALQVISSSEVWIGIHRASWWWSDGTPVSFTNWNSEEENPHSLFAYCATEMSDQTWNVEPCLFQTYPFYCQSKEKDKKRRNVVKIPLSSNLDLSDPAVYNLLLEQISQRFEEAGHADVKIKWTTPPKKQGQEEEKAGPPCQSLVPSDLRG